jgi:pilus assembly protein TadC
MRSKWALLVIGGLLGSVVGVIGASISDPEVGFPAWVDLTGVLAGFGLGVLATGLLATLTRLRG